MQHAVRCRIFADGGIGRHGSNGDAGNKPDRLG